MAAFEGNIMSTISLFNFFGIKVLIFNVYECVDLHRNGCHAGDRQSCGANGLDVGLKTFLKDRIIILIDVGFRNCF